MGCGCNRPRRPNVNDNQALRSMTTPPQTFVWQVGNEIFEDLLEARKRQEETKLPIYRKKK